MALRMISDKVTSFLAQQYAKRVAYELNQVGMLAGDDGSY